MKTGIQVGEVMATRPVVAGPHMSLQSTARLMAERDVHSVVIVDGDKILGIVTDEDFVRKIIVQDAIKTSAPISTIMEKQVITISPRKDINDAIMLMREHHIRQLPVVDKTLAGYITMKDILKIQPELIEILVEKSRMGREFQEDGEE